LAIMAALHDLPNLDALTEFDARLRQVPYRRPELEQAVRSARRLLRTARTNGDRASELRLHGYIGTGYRVLGHWRASQLHFEAAVELAKAANDQVAEVVALIRLGETLRCADDCSRAKTILQQALERTRADARLADYEDFALQHLGKCLIDTGDPDQAIACLEAALALRTRKSAPGAHRVNGSRAPVGP
jgi:HTH-type transcriptional regulator, pleiotropic regulator of extracellular virulence genes